MKKLSSLPHIGMRIIKSAIAVFLCFVVYFIRGKQGIVFYSCLSVLWCIQSDMGSTFKKALQRTIGTVIGGIYGLIVILINIYLLAGSPAPDIFKYLLISVMIIPTIYTTVVLKKPDASYFSCVVFLSIVVLHLDENPYLFVFNRVCDTMIGIVIGMIVNSVHLPRRRKDSILFVSGVDDVLLDKTETIPPYTRVKLNGLIKNGIHFTLSTERTPASLIPLVSSLNLNMPVIAMNGAVLYDLKENRYIKTNDMTYGQAAEVIEFIRQRGFNCFINSVLEDMLVIHHQELKNEAEKDIYKRMHTSPYRNYLNMEFPKDIPCIYIMVVDETPKTEELVRQLSLQEFSSGLRIIHYPSTTYKGYSYIKIYDKTATRENMLEYLCKSVECDEVITFGTAEGVYDYIVEKNEPDKTAKLIGRLYEPVGFKRTGHKQKEENAETGL